MPQGKCTSEVLTGTLTHSRKLILWVLTGSLEGLLILRAASREELSTRPPRYLLEELERLERLETASLPELLRYIDSLPCGVPSDIARVLTADAALDEARRVASARSEGAEQRPQPSASRPAASGAPEAPALARAPMSDFASCRFWNCVADRCCRSAACAAHPAESENAL